MATYVALTTTNPQVGWQCLAVSNNRTQARHSAEEHILATGGPVHTDIYTQTKLRNLTVASKSEVKRAPAWRAALDRWTDEQIEDAAAQD